MEKFRGFKKSLTADLSVGILSFSIVISDNLTALNTEYLNNKVDEFTKSLIEDLKEVE